MITASSWSSDLMGGGGGGHDVIVNVSSDHRSVTGDDIMNITCQSFSFRSFHFYFKFYFFTTL